MEEGKILFILSVVLLLSIPDSVATRGKVCRVNRASYGVKESLTVSILRSRGYKAQEYYVRTQNNQYTLSLVRATNPLVNGGDHGLPDKDPILFVHGWTINANAFILSKDGVKPKDYTAYGLDSMSEEELLSLIQDDTGSNSLAFVALNFGYEVWLLNRRTTQDSRMAHAMYGRDNNHKGKFYSNISLDSDDYWRFSWDEQALYDIPETIDVILKKTRKEKLIYLGYSAGTTMAMMFLSDKPELADKISKAIFWAPVLDLPNGFIPGFYDKLFLSTLETDSKVPGTYPPEIMINFIMNYLNFNCNFPISKPLACEAVMDPVTGKGTSFLMSEYFDPKNHYTDTAAKFERSHYYQSVVKKQMHHFDFMDEHKNLMEYNQTKPPIYDVSKIKLRSIHMWFGSSDKMGRLENFDPSTRERLKVPIKLEIVGDDEVLFNHLAFLAHIDITKLLIVPTMKVIASEQNSDNSEEDEN